MKKIEFISIGEIQLNNEKKKTRRDYSIIIRRAYREGLTKLSLFSHCLLIFKEEKELLCYVVEIIEINEKDGELRVAFEEQNQDIKGELVDIKPYFPCEETVGCQREYTTSEKNPIIPFKGETIGEYLFVKNCGLLQLRKSDERTGLALEKALLPIEGGSYLRVLWWFHRFDDKKYRNHLMCKPPYQNAPRTGVFATRSPVRPNPVASTIVKVKSVDPYNHNISVLGFDGFENSMILQIMPYRETIFKNLRVPEWVEHWTDHKTFFEESIGLNIFRKDKEQATLKTEAPFKEEDRAFFQELEIEKSGSLEFDGKDDIVVENASIHNLKSVSVRIPKQKITVITGVSGSGKSSLAFDTIYNESQKQFIDLVAANSPLGNDLKDSKVERIYGLQPAIAIEQRNLSANPRSTVASITKVGDYLRLLFIILGKRVCPNCGSDIPDDNVCKRCGAILFEWNPSVFNYNHPEHMCPVCKGLGEELQIDPERIIENPNLSILDGASVWWGNLRTHREHPNANWMRGEALALATDLKENLEVPFKELSVEYKKQVLYGSNGREVTLCYENSNGRKGTIKRPVEGVVNILHRLMRDQKADKSMTHIQRFMVNKKCSRCNGERLLEEGRLANINGMRYPEVTKMSISDVKNWCHRVYSTLSDDQKQRGKEPLRKLVSKLKKLEQVGLGYLDLDRSVPSLSGGEAQRLKIATQFGSGLTNILYVMDEPSKGLHPKDYRFLIESIKELKKQGNTVVMVEHKKAFIDMADYLIEVGPGAGHYGGQLLRAGEVNAHDWDGNMEPIYKTKDNNLEDSKLLTLKGVLTNNLKNIEVNIPLSKFTCVIGVSGSGKSSLVSKTLYPAVAKALGKGTEEFGSYDSLTGVEAIRDIHYVSQKAIGKNSRSNPGTYTGVFDLIRDFYAALPKSKKEKLTKEHFSFNSVKGQCEECKGAGEIIIPMHFMADIFTPCPKCEGKRYKEKILTIKHEGYTIADLLDLEIAELKDLFNEEPKIFERLNALDKVGLSYMKLGQSASTLSGGEAQRIKLAKELWENKSKGVVYVLDEPTTGLHDEDVKKLNHIFKELTTKGGTVIVIEHNPLLINYADYIIEMGPEGGALGGHVLNAGWLEK